jgi:hypothetical protein
MLFWGTLLAVVVWSIWTTQNHFIFRTFGSAGGLVTANSLYFSVLHLFEYWTGQSALTNVGTASIRTTGQGAGPTGAVGLTTRFGGGASASGAPISDQLSDEDLLD